ncbi:MAG TPA: UDP-N-acetylmuramoyl-L-alanine--D-glutamate ligase [Desulfatiglandales bacterium]|nr:UDP-N-acetylmuramoyl-L-alanine--D-glutamate ligase [Desulfatiglandales bacterium]
MAEDTKIFVCMNLSGKRVLVVGLGDSGLAAARWLFKQGSQVTVSETKKDTELDKNTLAYLLKSGIALELSGHKTNTFMESDLIVVSPGVPLDIEPLAQAREKGIPVIGELELACRYIQTPCVAVTGTNGKSTVVTLIGEIIRRGGKSAFVGGNIGRPVIDYIDGEQTADYAVLEISSFQLDTTQTFSPFLALILNISPDHLDRYADYHSYAKSKERIFANQGPGQILILNDDDPWLSQLRPQNGVTLYKYGLGKKSGRNAYLIDGKIVVELPGRKPISFDLDRFSLPGDHNRANLMGVTLSSLSLNIPPRSIQEAIDHFKGLPHRIELVDTLKGVSFYDDSKATNIDAAIKSIDSFSKPIVLIAGGRHKGSDYFPLVQTASGKVKGAVFLGEASNLLAEAFGNTVSWRKAKNMVDAVSIAFDQAKEGDADVVLLAPACSSFDMFTDYKHRGRVFREAVRKLKNGN